MLRVLLLLFFSAISIVCCDTKIPIAIAYYDEIKDLPNLIVDVREPYELEENGSIPLSINVPLAEVEKRFSEETSDKEFMKLFNRAKPTFMDIIIVACGTGRRAQIAVEILVELGYKHVKNYHGSEWAD